MATSGAVCKYCGETVKWFQEIVGRSKRWIPTDPITGQDHRNICYGGDSRIALGKVQGKAIKPAPDVLLDRIMALEKRVTTLEEDKYRRNSRGLT